MPDHETVDKQVLELSDVCFAYGAQEVLHNVTLRIGARDLVAVVGPNGGGKSTLLRIMLGLLSPRCGQVRVFGQPPEAVRRRVGYVPQQLAFDPRFPVSALDVVLMGRMERHALGPYRRDDRAAAQDALEQVEMAPAARRAFADLSGGERQRVIIAQALVTGPDLLLMDEPTASVDALVEHKLYELFHRLNQRLTMVLVSHNLNVVTRHASHVVCVNRTATLHTIGQVTTSVFREAYGGDLALLHHGPDCEVVDPSDRLRSPHRAEAKRGAPQP